MSQWEISRESGRFRETAGDFERERETSRERTGDFERERETSRETLEIRNKFRDFEWKEEPERERRDYGSGFWIFGIKFRVLE
eukprot:1235261-Amorphochlora_amoeboformis.AAC.1